MPSTTKRTGRATPSDRRYARTGAGVVCLFLLAVPRGIPARAADPPPVSASLEQQLLQESSADLAQAARARGDVNRGAILFYQPYLTCTKCHSLDPRSTLLGPDLTLPGAEKTDAYLVEAVLQPSKAIKKGYEPIVVITDDGKSVTGLLAEDRPESLVLRDPAQDGKTITIAKDRIEEQAPGPLSVMPAGLVIGLADRQQFLDLIHYLIEITEKGLSRARQLEPPPHLYALPPIPEYEKDIDHAGLIGEWNAAAFQRGQAIYNYLCINCHGTKDQPGSLPTSLRFASGTFKNGFEPYRMYQTLTQGSGMMMPQTWMVPQQKYDVIHYIREAYLKPYNPTQYAAVNAGYLAQLPKGSGRGPQPETIEPWVTMDYGPQLTATYEVGSDEANFAYKGIAIRLDPGPGGVSRGTHWMLYDHDTLRVAAAWSGKGFIDWDAILFNGRHAVHPRLVGQVHLANPTGPGWADPASGDFADPRLRGRDNRPYGPLPRTWAHYRGLYHFGNQVLIDYTVGDARVLELPGVETSPGGPVFTRTFQIGPRNQDLVLQVAQHPSGTGPAAGPQQADSIVVGRPLERPDAGAGNASRPLVFDGATHVQAAKPEDFDLTRHDYSISARIHTRVGGSILCQTRPTDRWVPDGKALFVRGGRLVFDIGWVGAVTTRRKVDDGAWHEVAMTWEHESGRVRLYVDGRLEGEGNLQPKGEMQGHVIRVGFTAPNFPEQQSHFSGELADVRFYQRRLSDEEVRSLQDREGSDRGLLARWPLDAQRDGVVADATRNGHDGTVIQGKASVAPSRLLVAGAEGLQSAPVWLTTGEGQVRLRIPAGDQTLKFRLWFADAQTADEAQQLVAARAAELSAGQVPQPIREAREGDGIGNPSREKAIADLAPLTRGGLPHWTASLQTQATLGDASGPFAVDVLSHPARNPWLCRTRFTGFDFFADGQRAAICSWDGDVWLVRGVDRPEQGLSWQRIASGLFQPLGLKIVRDQIYVGCRDQIVILRDLNGDAETDFYENFNNDHQVTDHFHEFAMGLQTDAAGNFSYAKGARHALPALVPHHGTLLRVSADGSQTEILANGFRAPNGVCLNPDGTWFVTDQEGHWTPKNRINLITAAGGFYGNFWGYHDAAGPGDEFMLQPLAWITNAMDRSPAELVWVDSDAWGPLKGALLNTSYGYGMLYTVPHEVVGGQMQGGVCPFPLRPFPTGIMRVRFHPQNGQLYTCGMFAWAGNQTEPGGFYRIRYTGKPVHLPIGLHARHDGIQITFSGPLDPPTARDAKNYATQVWSIQRSANYGSDHFDERPLAVSQASLSADGKTVTLQIPQIQPTWCMEIKYWLKGAGGETVNGTIHNTIHQLPAADAEPK